MVQHKRKPKVRKVRAAKKKAKKVLRTLKRVSAPKSRAVKKRLRARLPARAHKAAAPKAALAVRALAPKPDDKSAKAKTPIKSAKQALELLEAKVNEVKAKGKGGRGGRRGRKDEWLIPAEMPKEDAETRRTRLKNLIKLGKERGFLTYSEINDHLPDDLVDAEQIEAIISTFGDMGIQVYDQAPDQETLLIASDATPVAQTDEDVEEQAEAALSTVDSEFGRTTDPVRMYMREMGSVELLTREGEIEIAKRIEEGLRHMIQAISACPTTVREILELADKVEKDESRVDEVVDGLIDPNAKDDFDPKKAESPEDEEAQIEEEEGDSEEDEGAAQSASLLKLRGEALEKFARIRRLYDKMAKALEHKGSKDKDYLRARDQISNELMGIRFTARTVERLSDSVRSLVDEIRRHERQIHDICVEKAQMPRQHFIRIFAGTEGSRRWLTGDINAAQPWSEALRRLEPSILELLGKIQAVQQKIGIPIRDLKEINKMNRISRQILQETGQEPDPATLAARMEMPEEKIRKILKISKEPISMETPIGDDDDSHLGDFIEDQSTLAPSDAATFASLRDVTKEVLDTLTPREAKVLRMRFGIEMSTDHTLEEVGKQFDVTRERIRQIEAKALRKLRHPSRSERLKSFLDQEG